MSTPTKLVQTAYRIRRYALRMGEVQGQGYIGQALGWADVLAVAYGHAMNYRARRPRVGRARPLPAVARPLRDRALRGADRGRHHSGERARDLRQRRQPPADVGHGHLHAGHGDLRRLARPGPGDRRGHGTRAEAEEEPGLRLQLDVRRRARRGLHLGGGDGRRPPPARQPDLPGRHQQPAGRRPVGQGARLRAAGRQVGRLRLARAARRRQRPVRGARRLRPARAR